jgi:hypothetical protein
MTIWMSAGMVGAALLAALLIGPGAGPGHAQVQTRSGGDDLRVEWSASEDRRGRSVVSGYVYNRRAGTYAVAVRLRLEALDGSGAVIGSSTAYVMGDVPPSSRAYFESKAPVKASTYRVTIDSFDWRGYGAGGG